MFGVITVTCYRVSKEKQDHQAQEVLLVPR